MKYIKFGNKNIDYVYQIITIYDNMFVNTHERGFIMSKTIIAACIGATATIAAAIIGVMAGKNIEQKNIQKQFNTAMGNGVNIVGNENEITINDIQNFMNNYQDLQKQKDSLLAQNSKYFDDLTDANSKIHELQSLTNSIPIFNYSNLALSIDAEDIPINKNNSMVTIDGRDYISKEIAEKLLDESQNITIKDNTLFIGKVVADRVNLVDQNVLNRSDHLSFKYTGNDSYGNLRSDSISNNYYGSTIIFTLEEKYSYLKCTISMSEDYSVGATTTLKISADDNVVYTNEIDKKTKPYDVEIPINNCELLTIDFNSGSPYRGCIISDAILYNE